MGICCLCFKQAENNILFKNGDRVCENCLYRYAMEEAFNLEESMAYISYYPYEFYLQSWLLQYLFAVYYAQTGKKEEMLKYVQTFCCEDFPHYIDFLVSGSPTE